MRRVYLFVCLVTILIVGAYSGMAQVRFYIDSLPKDTPIDEPIYMASSLNYWNPCDTVFQFKPTQDGRHLLTLTEIPDTFEFRLCRGSYRAVEVVDNGDSSRIYLPGKATVRLKIRAWRDELPKQTIASTANKRVRFLPTNLEMSQLNRRRTIRLYLPPNYFKASAFPVIYINDGQNIFDDATAFAGEWRVDELMDSLYYHEGFAAIIVAVYHGGKERINEFLPWENEDRGIGGDGDAYLKFIVKELKPFIDSHYRTDPRSQSTVLVGSAAGGLISFYAALQYPKIFGKVAVFSPTFDLSADIFPYLRKYTKKRRKAEGQTLYLYVGEKEPRTLVNGFDKVVRLLKNSGYCDTNTLIVAENSKGRHSERYWRSELLRAICTLFELK